MKSLENRLDKQSQAQFFSKSEILCMLKKDRAHQLKSAVGSVMPDLYRLFSSPISGRLVEFINGGDENIHAPYVSALLLKHNLSTGPRLGSTTDCQPQTSPDRLSSEEVFLPHAACVYSDKHILFKIVSWRTFSN